MSQTCGGTASARAEDLLRRVMGETRYAALVRRGYLEFPSKVRRGRVYRLDSSGNLAYRDPGQSSFSTTLCIQPIEPVPRADVVALRFLMLTADEPGLVATANPIRFSLWSIATAIYRDSRERYGHLGAVLYTAALLGVFVGSLLLEGASLIGLLGSWPVAGLVLCVIAAPAAVLGFVLALAGLADLWSAALAWICQGWWTVSPRPPDEARIPGE